MKLSIIHRKHIIKRKFNVKTEEVEINLLKKNLKD